MPTLSACYLSMKQWRAFIPKGFGMFWNSSWHHTCDAIHFPYLKNHICDVTRNFLVSRLMKHVNFICTLFVHKTMERCCSSRFWKMEFINFQLKLAIILHFFHVILNDKMTDEMFHQFVNNPSLQLFGHDLEMYLPCSTPYFLNKKKNWSYH